MIYLLGLARFTLALAGWDTGSPFGGLGSSREMFFHFLTEIGMFSVFTILVIHWQTADITRMIDKHSAILQNLTETLSSKPGLVTTAAIQDLGLIFLAIAFASILLFETGRIPVDNPATHLELTMASKAIFLEFAGRDLALLEWAETIKFTFLVGLFGVLFLPGYVDIKIMDIMLFTFRAMILTIGLAFWEVCQPKKRLGQTPGLIWGAMFFCGIAFILVMLKLR
jgi:formate hydrogenlyase subunit 4